ncbi:MerR family transcriptional regulator [Rubripirellula reticaptiva]|uniref:Zinc-responsive transcriptional regulator n=1 Tax=Rubripirellula reticaptiva TaxID=2528013 RepID=A0A5C6ED41_9BACT|nr:helix-turn-helix domain-containing protein [Rubripirellula reticaptiva]TWU46838.1 zinc-responsive transcriptional regulator [Rubripirellula reticaptiva]
MSVDERQAKPRFIDMLRVGEAADFLGVCKETLRNWDRSGKLVPKRNPVTGYRYYKQEDLERFFKKVVEERGDA